MDKGSKSVGESSSSGSGSNDESTCKRDSAYWDKVMAETLAESERQYDETIARLVKKERRRRFFRSLLPCCYANEKELWN